MVRRPRLRDRTFVSGSERSLRLSDRGLQRAFRARKVLRDCYAHLGAIECATEAHALRRAWLAFVVDARRVGHILHKVDAAHRSHLAHMLSERFEVWRSHDPIFQLIEEERNMLLKEGVSSLKFGEHDDAGKVLVFGEFVEVSTLAQRILDWWELNLSELEDRAEQLRKRRRTERNAQ